MNLKIPNKNIALTNLSIYYTWKNVNLKSMPQLGMMNMICPMNLSLFPIYFKRIIKRHETIAGNSPVKIYVNKIKNRIVFKVKTGYKLELLTEETMQLLGSLKKDIDQNKNGELVPRLETVEVLLGHCNLVNNNYQQASEVLFTFVPNKQFSQLITITPHSRTMLKTTNVEFSFIEIWFTDQNNRRLEIEDNVNITLIIGIS